MQTQQAGYLTLTPAPANEPVWDSFTLTQSFGVGEVIIVCQEKSSDVLSVLSQL